MKTEAPRGASVISGDGSELASEAEVEGVLVAIGTERSGVARRKTETVGEIGSKASLDTAKGAFPRLCLAEEGGRRSRVAGRDRLVIAEEGAADADAAETTQGCSGYELPTAGGADTGEGLEAIDIIGLDDEVARAGTRLGIGIDVRAQVGQAGKGVILAASSSTSCEARRCAPRL